ncbi:MAG: hypothetical protein R2741_04035 [Methanolobus sp.]
MHNVNLYDSQITRLSEFLRDIKYIIVFYVLGDFLTTAKALNYGFEENDFLAAVMQDYGVGSLLILKILFLIIVYWNYIMLKEAGSKWTDLLWVTARESIAIVGLFLVVNNLMVIFMECSLLQAIQTMAL